MLSRLLPASLTSAALLLGAPLVAVVAGEKAAPPARTAPADARLQTKLYEVADLVVPIERAAEDKGGAAKKAAPATCEGRLIKLLTASVRPDSWACAGGAGTVDYFPQTMSLVISQTPETHEKIEGLLKALRRTQDVQVALEVKIISFCDDGLERVGIDFNRDSKGKICNLTTACVPQLGEAGTTFLNDVQVFQFLEAVQSHPTANVMQSPKMTLLNGQKGTVSVTDQKYYTTGVSVHRTEDHSWTFVPNNEAKTTGLYLTAQPVVSADRRFVQVYLNMSQTELASAQVPLFPIRVDVEPTFEGGTKGTPVPFTQFIQQPTFNAQALEKTVAIPDGGTVLLGGLKKIVETRTETATPVLSKIPYLNRLFKNVGYANETRQVFVMVTPRVILNGEEEQRVGNKCAEDAEMCRGYEAVQNLCPDSRFAELATLALKQAKRAGGEEAEAGCCAKTCARTPNRQEKVIAELLKAYDAACAEGRADEAEKLARAALVLDPTCFGKARR